MGPKIGPKKIPSSATTHKWLTEKTILGPKFGPKSPYRRPQPNKWWTGKKIMGPKIGLDSFQKVCWAEIVSESYITESENKPQTLPTFRFG